MNIYHRPPSEESLSTLAALKAAVAQTLEKKRKLGLYAVIWKNGEVILKHFDDTPNETQINNGARQLLSFQQLLCDSPEMINAEYLGIEEKRKP